MKPILLFLSMIILANLTYSAGYSYRKIINEIKVDKSNTLRISTSESDPWVDVNRCNGTDKATHTYLDMSTESGKAMYSLILSAKMAGKPVGMWLAGCKVMWDKNLPIITSVYVK